jgi:GGDEF domain-containing protein
MMAKLEEFLAEPIVLKGGELRASVSVGLAVYPDDGSSEESLVNQADTAMYRDKRGTERPPITRFVQARSASAPTQVQDDRTLDHEVAG